MFLQTIVIHLEVGLIEKLIDKFERCFS